jgi:hypothetical protein
MVLCGFARVMRRMQHVRVGAMRMVGRPLMRTGRIMPCGLFMMFRRMLVMLGRFGMMLLRGMFGHAGLPVLTCIVVPAALQSHRCPPLSKKGLFPKNVPDKDGLHHEKLPPRMRKCQITSRARRFMVKQRETFPWQG